MTLSLCLFLRLCLPHPPPQEPQGSLPPLHQDKQMWLPETELRSSGLHGKRFTDMWPQPRNPGLLPWDTIASTGSPGLFTQVFEMSGR